MPDPLDHFEIGVTDLDKSAEFYSRLFGWEMKPDEGSPDPYMLIYPGEGLIGGLNLCQGDMPTYVAIYVKVDDCGVTLEKALEKGAIKIIGKTWLESGQGWYAMFVDPDMNPIGLWSRE